MDTVESSELTTTEENSTGFFSQLRQWISAFFSGAPVSTSERSAAAPAAADDEIILAPGGYEIHVRRSSTVDDQVQEMLPEVKEGLTQLPPLPHVVVELLREIQKSNSSADSLARIAASDPALTATLLRTVNSAAMGLTRKITAVSEAVNYLGFNTVKSIVVRLRLGESLPATSAQSALDIEDLWVHALAVSYAAECLAERVPGVDRGFVSTLGLLHDIGKLVVIAKFPAQVETLRVALRENKTDDALSVERKILGIDHAHLGGELGAAWKLPADLVQAIHWHHHPATGFHVTDPLPLRKAVHIVQIADQLAKYCYPYSDCMSIEALPPEAFEILGLEASLPKLLDSRMKHAISRAIFFTESNNENKSVVARRFMRPVLGDAAQAAAYSRSSAKTRVIVDDAGITQLLASEVVNIGDTDDIQNNAGPNRVHLVFLGGVKRAARCVKIANEFLAELEISNHARAAAGTTISYFLPNLFPLCEQTEAIHCAIEANGHELRVAFSAPGLATERRLGKPANPEIACRLADGDLAHVLNLDWFDRIAISSSGDTVVFRVR